MSDHQLDLDRIQIGMRGGMACAINAMIAVGAFFLIRFWVETG
jgi:hypothetical protein